jgi:hypothetical protein
MRIHRPVLIIFAAALLAVPACSKKEAPATPATPTVGQAGAPAAAPFAVSAITLGKQIGADKKVTEQGSVFAPGDTIYASVSTTGASPSVALTARWTYDDGQLVNESQQTIAPTGPSVTEFHIAKASGWPVGNYKVEISTPGGSLGSKSFEVR